MNSTDSLHTAAALLSLCFRATTVDDLSSLLPHSVAHWGSWCQRAKSSGLLKVENHAIRRLPAFAEPLIRWRPFDRTPNFGHIAYTAQSRWRAPTTHSVLTATDLAKRRYGAPLSTRGVRPSELEHDIAMSLVFLQYKRDVPDVFSRWIFEDLLVAGGSVINCTKAPDALLAGDPPTVVEFAGSYSKEKIQAFHEEFSRWPYDLW